MNTRLFTRQRARRAPALAARPARPAMMYTTAQKQAPRLAPHIDACPSPTCACAPMPELDIDRKSKMRGVFVPYKEQVLVCSGRDDWTSKIEEEEGPAGDVVRGLKGGFGRGGQFCDVSVLAPWGS